jgi:aspartate/tyrosine/aromatic aminotransferase
LPTKCLVSQAEWDSAMELQDKWKAEVKELRESIYALRERMRE